MQPFNGNLMLLLWEAGGGAARLPGDVARGSLSDLIIIFITIKSDVKQAAVAPILPHHRCVNIHSFIVFKLSGGHEQLYRQADTLKNTMQNKRSLY